MLEKRMLFKEMFKNQVSITSVGETLLDSGLLEAAKRNGFPLTINEIKSCIRELETVLGEELKVRLRRKWKEGYQVVSAIDQSRLAVKEGSRRLKSTCKRTAKRLGYVNTANMSSEEILDHTSKAQAFKALAALAGYTKETAVLTHEEVSVVDSAVRQIEAIQAIKKSKK